ncbi:hypothetical protein X975_18317, partial [Stegodyphus mimosarum]
MYFTVSPPVECGFGITASRIAQNAYQFSSSRFIRRDFHCNRRWGKVNCQFYIGYQRLIRG